VKPTSALSFSVASAASRMYRTGIVFLCFFANFGLLNGECINDTRPAVCMDSRRGRMLLTIDTDHTDKDAGISELAEKRNKGGRNLARKDLCTTPAY
jgi:hypothetical protein